MKKLIALMFCLTVAVMTAQAEPDATKTKLPSDMQTRSLLAHDNTVFDVTLRVATRFKNQAQEGENLVDKPCSAVKIDRNWLIASLTCRGTTSTATAIDHNGNAYGKSVEYRNINYIEVEGVKVMPRDFFVDETSKVILIRAQDNEELVDKLDEKSSIVANLLVANHPKDLLTAVTEAYIQREGACWTSRCSAEVKVEQYCADTKCYKVEWKIIDGDAGDPLFILSKKHDKAEFLAGLNVAEVDGSSPESGHFYKVFDETTLQFIKSTVEGRDPRAWKRIRTHTVDEQTF